MAIRGTSRQRKNDENRRALMEAATDLFGRYSFRDVTIDDICERAGLSKSTFYLHFKSKDDLYMLYQAFDRDSYIEAHFSLDESAPFGAQLLGFMRCNFDFILGYGKERARTLYVSHIKMGLYYPYEEVYHEGAYTSTLAALIERGMREGAFRHEQPFEGHWLALNSWIIGLQIDWSIAPPSWDDALFYRNIEHTVGDMLA